jgi:hypothetical protein
MFWQVLPSTMLLSCVWRHGLLQWRVQRYEEPAASVFRAAESSTLQTESVRSTESTLLAYKAARCHIQEDSIQLGCSYFLILPIEQVGVAMTQCVYPSQILAGVPATLTQRFCGFYQAHT